MSRMHRLDWIARPARRSRPRHLKTVERLSHYRPLAAEQLEDRRMLATFMVMNNADSGADSLRDATASANSMVSDDANGGGMWGLHAVTIERGADTSVLTLDGPVPSDPTVQVDATLGDIDGWLASIDDVPGSVGTNLAAQSVRHELVFVDTAAQDYQQLVDDLLAQGDESRQFDVLILDGSRDGIEQISEALADFDDLDALHIVSHGTDGRVQLGNTWLDTNSINGYAGQIASWQDALASDADLLIYGCDLAGDADGQSLVESIGELTDADVAASTDETGNAFLGGDWDLEFTKGAIETGVAFGSKLQTNWMGVLDAAAAGSETLVNTTTANGEKEGDVAIDADGNFVVVWEGDDADNGGVYFQRYDAAGNALGGETLVNTTTKDKQENARVAMDADGDFVVVWEGKGDQVGQVDDKGVFFQRFNSSGVAQGGETLANTITADDRKKADVAIDDDGNFTIVWQGKDSAKENVSFQRFDALGNALGSETVANTTITGSQKDAAIAMDADGDFVVVWRGNGDQVGHVDDKGVFAQRFNSSGVAQGGETLVNTTTANDEKEVDVAMDADGDYVVVWESDSDSSDIYFQRYDAAGNAQGGETVANTTTSSDQKKAAVSMDSAGDFVIVWDGEGPGDTDGVFGQEFDSSGSRVNGELSINTTTSNAQNRAAVAMSASGDFVAVWDGKGDQVGNVDDKGVFFQRYEEQAPTVAITRVDANPTNANTVVFGVDFSEDVVNVDAADFVLDLAGVAANATVTVDNAGDADASTYTVAVDTITGDGTLGLDIAGGNNITDLATNVVNTTPTTDEVYTIDTIAPVVTVANLLTSDPTPELTGTVDDPAATITIDVGGKIGLAATNNGNGTWTLPNDATIWSGPSLTFTKAAFANWNLPDNQDRLTDNVWLTRQNTRALFNITVESSCNCTGSAGPSPLDTEWAAGTTAEIGLLSFGTFGDLHGGPGGGGPPGLVGRDLVLHLITDAIYVDLEFLSWTQGSASGGGFSYVRSTPGSAPTNITTGVLADGTYDVVVTATDALLNVGTNVTIDELTIDTIAPVVTVANLATSDATPELTGTVDDPAATITVDVGGQIGLVATNNGNGTWTLPDNTITALADGTYDVVVRATDVALNVGTDATIDELTVDTIAPVVTAVGRNSGGQNFDELVTLFFAFSEDVSATIDKFDLTLLNTSTGTPVDLTPAAFFYDGPTNTATWDLHDASIGVGFHTATLSAAGISDASSHPLDGNDDGIGGDNFVTTEADAFHLEAGPHVSTIHINDSGTISDFDIRLNIDHAFDEDLDVFLVGPYGTRIELFTDVGSDGNNFTDTLLDDDVATSIIDGTAPFTGSFRPEGSLSVLDGMPIHGTWKLEITDDTPFDGNSGSLNSWSILFDTVSAANVIKYSSGLPLLVALAGDTNLDGDIDSADIQTIVGRGAFDKPAGGPYRWSEGDFNNDGLVANDDIQLILATNQFGAGAYAAMGEPATDATFDPIEFSAPGVSMPLVATSLQPTSTTAITSAASTVALIRDDREAVLDAKLAAEPVLGMLRQREAQPASAFYPPSATDPILVPEPTQITRRRRGALPREGDRAASIGWHDRVSEVELNVTGALTDPRSAAMDRGEIDTLATSLHVRWEEHVWDDALLSLVRRDDDADGS